MLHPNINTNVGNSFLPKYNYSQDRHMYSFPLMKTYYQRLFSEDMSEFFHTVQLNICIIEMISCIPGDPKYVSSKDGDRIIQVTSDILSWFMPIVFHKKIIFYLLLQERHTDNIIKSCLFNAFSIATYCYLSVNQWYI